MKQSAFKRFRISGVLLLLLIVCLPAHVKAEWKQKGSSWYYYDEAGVLQKKKWIDDTYYVGKSGARVTGLAIISGKRYYFDNSGKVLKNYWIRTKNKNYYYAGKNGVLYTNGIYTIKDQDYLFSKTGVRMSGRRLVDGRYYYFRKTNGQMVRKVWVKINSKFFYFGEKGRMVTDKWVGFYYCGSDGVRVTSAWQDSRYLGSDGLAVSGLQTIGGSTYYFDPSDRKKITSTTKEVDGVTYTFDASGKGTKKEQKAPPASVSVQPEYYSHPYVDDQTLLSTIIYCEAGNQSYTGKLAVGLVIMNRVNSSLFPNKFREVIYASGQFNPTWDGAMERYLKNPPDNSAFAECEKAAKVVMNTWKSYSSGKTVYLKINGKKTKFPHLFFMTPASYSRLGLRSAKVQIGGHVFFTNWVR